MKVTLLYEEREWGKEKSYFDSEEICKDLNLRVLFQAAGNLYDGEDGKTVKIGKERDGYIVETMKKVMTVPLCTEREVIYRQKIVREAVENYDRMEQLYDVAKEAGEEVARYAEDKKKRVYGSQTDHGRRYVADISYLEKILLYLERIHEALRQWEPEFVGDGLRGFTDSFFTEYNDNYRECLKKVIGDIRTSVTNGVMEYSAALGPGLAMTAITLCDIRPPEEEKKNLLKKFTGFCKSIFEEEDETTEGAGQNLMQDIGELKNVTLGAMMQLFQPFMEEKEMFFRQLYLQTAFLMGAANLYRRVHRIGVDFCFPKVTERDDLSFTGLAEMSLALHNLRCPVQNDLSGDKKHLVVVTGANQGGKSTYLRSIGIAQVLLQCGMYVPASSFASGLYQNIFTHFTRREDSAMNSGRLDEELGRMERIIDHLTKDSVLFLNESFATTTEKEGSLIAEDITGALYERGIRVMMVTHLMAYAQKCYQKGLPGAIFLSAEREEDGNRTFRMVEQAPELTSYGLDLYDSMIKKH